MKQSAEKVYATDAIMRYARLLGFGEILHRTDSQTGLQAIIALHSTKLGPAIGGCRFHSYKHYNHALVDALRLASMMTLKNAACGLAHGGGKAVVITPTVQFDRRALFNSLGEFLNDLNGRYITAMDVGTTSQDMNAIAERTQHVIGASQNDPIQENPAPYTAKGVFRGIQAAIKFKLNVDSPQGLTVAIQGAGKVGYHLAKQLHSHGANIIVCDPNTQATQKFAQEFNATVVKPEAITQQKCDIFSPCALGGTLTQKSVTQLQTKIVAGCANNQLAHKKVDQLLHERDILYVPDFIVNAGGVIHAASVHDYHDARAAHEKIDLLYDKLLNLMQRAKSANLPTNQVAYQYAQESLLAAKAIERVK